MLDNNKSYYKNRKDDYIAKSTILSNKRRKCKKK
ncbi:hypothetical protein [Buchnera aphidicola]